MNRFNINFGDLTNSGIVKEHNSDAIINCPLPNGHLFAVCDGHSGNEGHGALASRATSEEIRKYFHNRSYSNWLKALTNAVSYANYCVYNLSQKEEKFNGIGSTLAALLIQGVEVYYAYAGDSRIYLYKGDQLVALTRDHIADPANIAQSEVTVLVGKEKDIKFGVCKSPIQIEGNERFLLCTDGLTDWVSMDDVSCILSDDNMSPEYKAVQLFELTKSTGGNDNISVQVIEFSKMEANNNNSKKPGREKSSVWTLVTILGIIILIVFLGFQGYKHLVTDGLPVHQNKTTESLAEEMQQESKLSNEDVELDEEEKAVEKEITESETYVDESGTDQSVSEGAKSAEDIIESQIAAKTAANTGKKTENTQDKQETKAPVIKPQVAGNTNTTQYFIHVVEKGQNLFRISLQYNVPMKKLEELNGEKATNLTIGAELKIPVKALHKVGSGETLSSISKKYNSSVDEICAANKIEKNKGIDKGQTLVIPLAKK
jgi:PPM family protein phosphatase